MHSCLSFIILGYTWNSVMTQNLLSQQITTEYQNSFPCRLYLSLLLRGQSIFVPYTQARLPSTYRIYKNICL